MAGKPKPALMPEEMTPQQAEMQELIQRQLGPDALVTKFIAVVEFHDGESRQLTKLTSNDLAYWDWFGMLQAVHEDMVVDWTGVLEVPDAYEDGIDDEL